jgi:hypothetical protein
MKDINVYCLRFFVAGHRKGVESAR